MKTILTLFLLTLSQLCHSQLEESFSDSNYSQHPVWMADTSKWTISPDLKLRSKSVVSGDLFSIHTQQYLLGPIKWEFRVQMLFNSSSANFIDVFLLATDSALLGVNNNGYFLRIGSTVDDICLYRKDSTAITKLLDGPDGLLNSSSNQLFITVTRDQRNEWSFHCEKESSSKTSFTSAYILDSVHNQSSYFGISIRQSTSSFFGKHYFDDISIQPLPKDSIAPRLIRINSTNPRKIELTFDEPIKKDSTFSLSNFRLIEWSESPVRIIFDSSDRRRISLILSKDIPERIRMHLQIQHLDDRYGNKMSDTVVAFFYYVPRIHDILITELMADPEPSAGLPATEWLELYNSSDFNINLKGWRILKPNSDPSFLPDMEMPPGTYIVFTSSIGHEKLSSFCANMPLIGFPPLSNEGDTIMLLSDSGKLIHHITYSSTWHENTVKQEGGWSLEMKDKNQPCMGNHNWTSSTGFYGGTPGQSNASTAVNPDVVPPTLINVYCTDSIHVHLIFNESLDSAASVNRNLYSIDHGIGFPVFLEANSPSFSELILTIAKPMHKDTLYQITMSGTEDCSGNKMSPSRSFFMRFSECEPGDLLINEILFDPDSGGDDFVEIINNSKKSIDLSTILIANRDLSGAIANSVTLNNRRFALLPGEYVVLTADKEKLSYYFLVKNSNAIVENKKLPSFPDDKGSVLLLNAKGIIVDELDYSSTWHFELLNDAEGLSLERLTVSNPTNSSSNWHSAAGKGTPGYENSQTYRSASFSGVINIEPSVFSPDLDGWQDMSIIRFRFPSEGYLLSVGIYDLNGIPIRALANNLLAGTSGMIQWNGLDDRGRMVYAGTYIVCAEYFNSRGERGKIKKTVVVAPIR